MPRREFPYVDDLADACLYLMRNYEQGRWINMGCGSDVTIAELARTVGNAVGFNGGFRFDISKPEGTPRKLLDTSKMTELG